MRSWARVRGHIRRVFPERALRRSLATKSRRALAFPAVLIVLSGLAPREMSAQQSADRSELLLSDWKPPKGQTCNIHVPKNGIQAVDEIVDSAGLHEAVARLWATTQAGPGRALFTIPLGVDSTGVRKSPTVIEDDLDIELAAEVVAMVVNHLREPQTSGGRARLEVYGDSAPRFRAGATETCMPVMRNRSHIKLRLESYANSINETGSAFVYVFINTQGRVMNAELKTSSGVKVIDQIALAMAYEMQFLPALNDRLPVPVWVSLPVSISQ